ncbi:two-component system, OmpR family, phosphate regulon sensor histidine kinase PhoR [Thermoflexales bacterium]|nr:two-component system, OmpR family, phosphate regulon sensor histidine kinase PhoR [Thermoflexales bacterium]
MPDSQLPPSPSTSNHTRPLPQTGDLRRSFTVLRRQADRLQRILEISQILTSTYDLDELLQIILAAAIELTKTEAASILLLNEGGTELRFAATTGSNRDKLMALRVPVENSLAGTILRSGEPMVFDDVRQDPRHFDGVDKQIAFESRSMLGVPLLMRERPVGVLEALNKLDTSPFGEEDGQVLMTLAAQAAVAIENARLITALQKAYEQLNRIDRIKSDFIAIASHELRTPLGLILGYASMLREDLKNTDTSQQLDVVMNSALRLRDLIDDMVNVQHIEEGKAKLVLTEFVLQEVVQRVVEAVRELYTTKEQELLVSLPAQPLSLKADREKIALVVNNLLTNAIKFTDPRGRIMVAAELKNGEVQVHVADTGIGIPAREVEHIFDRFYQVEPHLTRQHGGLGLGLAIAKGMIEMHGGKIWVESVEGLGSRFSFSVPVAGPSHK